MMSNSPTYKPLSTGIEINVTKRKLFMISFHKNVNSHSNHSEIFQKSTKYFPVILNEHLNKLKIPVNTFNCSINRLDLAVFSYMWLT